jgi:AcrR family transcriptional regulator
MAVEKIQNLSPRERIIKTAHQLFYSKGIKATGIDSLIAQSGVAKMTFYKHFPSKQALVMEFLRQRDVNWFKWFKDSLAVKNAKGKEKILAIFDVLEEWFSKSEFRGCAFINTAVETRDFCAEEHQFSIQHKKQLASYFEELVREIPLKEPKKLSEQLLLLTDGAIVMAQLQGSPDAAKIAKSIARVLLEKQG